MRVEGVERFAREAAVGAEVRNRQRELEAGRRLGRGRIRLLRPVGEREGEPVMPPALDEVEFLGRVGVGAVFGGNHFAAVVPAEAVGA